MIVRLYGNVLFGCYHRIGVDKDFDDHPVRIVYLVGVVISQQDRPVAIIPVHSGAWSVRLSGCISGLLLSSNSRGKSWH